MNDVTRALNGLSQVLATGIAVVRDPSANPRLALFALAALGIAALTVLMVIVLVVLLVQDALRPRPKAKVVASREQGPKSRRVRGLGWILGIALIVAVVVGYQYGVQDSTCARCHFTQRAFASRKTDDAHTNVSCSACHVPPGANGVMSAVGTGLWNLSTQLKGKAPDNLVSAPVSSSACLRCHRDVLSGVVTARNIRMRHSDVLAEGYICTDCHNTQGHGSQVTLARYPQMSQCITCHDGVKEKAGCSTCHSSDVGRASRVPADLFAKVQIKVTDCRGCHSMQPCIRCHGLELPHSEQFMKGYHARKALLQPQICMKCHTTITFCNNCHHFLTQANGYPKAPHDHESDFVSWHSIGTTSTSPPPNDCQCHMTKVQDPAEFCAICHATQPEH